MATTLSIANHLSPFLSSMVNKPWIVASTNYEKAFCDMVGWTVENGRYHDAKTPCNTRIEIKKGMGGMWFNEVRYSEVILGEIPESREPTITIYIEYKKNGNESWVTRIMIIDTKDLIEYMDISVDWARCCVNRHYRLREKGRGINMQQQLSTKQLVNLASHIVTHPVLDLPIVSPEQAKTSRMIRMEKLRIRRSVC